MKAFASALLLAGAHATAGAIDFNLTAESTMVSLSTNYAFLSLYGTKSPAMVMSDSKVTWAIQTDHANSQYTMTMTMVAAHETAYTSAAKTACEIYQCWKDYKVAEGKLAGLKGMRCHVFSSQMGASAG